MVDIKVQTGQHYAHFVAPATAIPAANWTSGPTLAQLQNLLNISEAVKIDGTDFNLEASESADDRSFLDLAGTQSRSFDQASGTIEIYTPRDGDTGIYSQTWDAISKPRTRVIVAQRPVENASNPLAAGDEINLFSAITDARIHNRNDVSRTLGIGLLPQGNYLVNYIVPSATPTAPTVTAQGGANLEELEVGTPVFLKVAYEGRSITNGAKYRVSDESIVRVRNGILIPVASGTATLTVSYPGAATLAPIDLEVAA